MDFPRYIETLPEDRKEAARAQFMLRVCALHFSPGGTMKALSAAVGFAPNTLTGVKKISAELAVRLEDALGKDRFPRSLFRPDLFSQAAQ